MSQDTQNEFSLTPEQDRKLKSVYDRLAAAMAVQVAAGYRVKPGDWGLVEDGPEDDEGCRVPGQQKWAVDPDGCLCPIACALVGTPVTGDYDEDAAALLGITEQQVANFIAGYDKAELVIDNWESDEYYWLGRTLRRRAVDRGEIKA
jgi:hypothetical protein